MLMAQLAETDPYSPVQFVKYTLLYKRLIQECYPEEAVRIAVGVRMGEDERIPDDVHTMWGIPVLRGVEDPAEVLWHSDSC